jgi:hypothetical protein
VDRSNEVVIDQETELGGGGDYCVIQFLVGSGFLFFIFPPITKSCEAGLVLRHTLHALSMRSV